MIRFRRVSVALCIGVAAVSLWTARAGAGPAEFSRFQEQQVWNGAVTLPVSAHLEYCYAQKADAKGDHEAAEKHLMTALSLWPEYPDAHFALARIYLLQGNPDALYHMVQGIIVTATSFEGQRSLAVNAAVILVIVLILASAIAWMALAIRYFPFLVHRLAETLKIRFDASAPRVTAYLLLLAPIALLPGYAAAAGVVMLATWSFMQRRERVFAFLTALMFAGIAFGAPIADRYTTVADPNSLVSMIARANYSRSDETLTRALSLQSANGLEAERQTALGMLSARGGEMDDAAAHLLRAISVNPTAAIAYTNLGNVYYLNGQYEKALEGYRKAEQIDSTDAVIQYNLAQAYIKTLLMSESSKALARASQHGVEQIADTFAQPARIRMAIYPSPYPNRSLWRIAGVEGRSENPGVLSSVIASMTGQSPRLGFWVTIGALVLALFQSRVVKRKMLAFQCSNCGEITCDGCCKDDRGSVICQGCAKASTGVTSDKVLEALLRQRRQTVVVRRRKAVRWTTVWLPGLRHIFYGRFVAGFFVAAVFSFAALMLWTRGYPLPQWQSLPTVTPLWKWIVPGAVVAISYWVALVSKQRYEVRNTRASISKSRTTDMGNDSASSTA
jgi:tetratricopeptide (TPR) repeat protein